MTLAKGHMSDVCQDFQKVSPLKLLCQFHLNFICSLLAKKETKLIYSCPGHMTKMADMPICGKKLEKSSSDPQG